MFPVAEAAESFRLFTKCALFHLTPCSLFACSAASENVSIHHLPANLIGRCCDDVTAAAKAIGHSGFLHFVFKFCYRACEAHDLLRNLFHASD